MSILTPDETILGLLASQPQHGYQLLDIFSNPQQLGGIWKLSTSQLYAVLKRLQQRALIVGNERVSENAPPRTEFSVTPEGTQYLQRWLHDPAPSASVRRVRVEFLSRLYIAQLLQQPCKGIIATQRHSCQQELARLTATLTHGRTTSDLAFELVIAQLEAILKWIDHCAAVLVDAPVAADH